MFDKIYLLHISIAEGNCTAVGVEINLVVKIFKNNSFIRCIYILG